MKTLRPHGTSSVPAFFGALGWTLFWAVLWTVIVGGVVLCKKHDPTRVVAGGSAVIGTIGLLLALRSPFARRALRYEITATEIVERSGVYWHEENRQPIESITTILESSGPLGRWLGLRNLTLVGTNITLYAIRDAEAVRRHLLDRRDALREATAEKDAELAQRLVKLLKADPGAQRDE